jgi:hypothetical protein
MTTVTKMNAPSKVIIAGFPFCRSSAWIQVRLRGQAATGADARRRSLFSASRMIETTDTERQRSGGRV